MRGASSLNRGDMLEVTLCLEIMRLNSLSAMDGRDRTLLN
jgi:hypothetical protein